MQTALAGESQLQRSFFLMHDALSLILGWRLLGGRVPKAQQVSELSSQDRVYCFTSSFLSLLVRM